MWYIELVWDGVCVTDHQTTEAIKQLFVLVSCFHGNATMTSLPATASNKRYPLFLCFRRRECCLKHLVSSCFSTTVIYTTKCVCANAYMYMYIGYPKIAV